MISAASASRASATSVRAGGPSTLRSGSLDDVHGDQAAILDAPLGGEGEGSLSIAELAELAATGTPLTALG